MKYWISVAEIVSLTPCVFAMPAGLIDRPSPSSVDATAAPARAVEIAPEPGTNKPPATADCEQTHRLPTTTIPRSFIVGGNLHQSHARGADNLTADRFRLQCGRGRWHTTLAAPGLA